MDSDTWIWPRTRQQVETDRAALKQSIQEYIDEGKSFSSYDYQSGAVEVFDWVLGDKIAPPWGPPEPPTLKGMARIQQESEMAIYGHRRAPEVPSQGWAVGVEVASMWIRKATKGSPGGVYEDEEPVY